MAKKTEQKAANGKAIEQAKPAQEAKPITKKVDTKPETKMERNRFGHAIGTQSATIDEMLAKGADLDSIAKKIGSSRGRVRSHVRHLIESHNQKIAEKDGLYRLQPEKGKEGKE